MFSSTKLKFLTRDTPTPASFIRSSICESSRSPKINTSTDPPRIVKKPQNSR
ncbi:hypothetical protein Hanom_Chr11g01064781 [Helianthus anomalus]